MKTIIQLRLENGMVSANLIEKAEFDAILELSEKDVGKALSMVGEFFKAGKLLVRRTRPETTIVEAVVGQPSYTPKDNDYYVHFSKPVRTLMGGKMISLSGIGETLEEAKGSLLGWFIGTEIHADWINDKGPLYFCGDKKTRFFQFERKMVFMPTNSSGRPSFN